INSSMSGCQSLSVFIFAARLVLPPLFTTFATRSQTFRNDSGPLGLPPPLNFSRVDLKEERSVPVPLPYLKSIASLLAKRMMSSIVSHTLWMKQALPCGYSYCDGDRKSTRLNSSHRC